MARNLEWSAARKVGPAIMDKLHQRDVMRFWQDAYLAALSATVVQTGRMTKAEQEAHDEVSCERAAIIAGRATDHMVLVADGYMAANP